MAKDIEMKTFLTVWFGQLFSTLGSGLTGFALSVWIYQQTDSVTILAFNLLANTIPNIIFAPLTGLVADRWDRRWVMILSDTIAGISTLAVALLWWNGNLQVWHVYIATTLIASGSAFQWPAYSATTSLLVPKEQLGRVNGMIQMGEALSFLVSPVLAGMLFGSIGLGGVILIDFATFCAAVVTLLIVRFPQHRTESGKGSEKESFFHAASFGWRYILARPGLLGLLIYFGAVNFLWGMVLPLYQPLILDLSSTQVLGVISSIGGLGVLLGSTLMSVWGGPKRRVLGILVAGGLSGIFLFITGIQPSLILIGFGLFGGFFCYPLLNASSQALWQSKVAPEVQGRVFAIRRLISWSTQPLALIVAGPLVDRVIDPFMRIDTPLTTTLKQIIGHGSDRGIGLLFLLLGVGLIFAAVIAYFNPRIRGVEEELPDAIPSTAVNAAGAA
jgi:MFS family permease